MNRTLVGTFRRELTDHLIVLGERHLLRCAREDAKVYNEDRNHLSLIGDLPPGREVERPDNGPLTPPRTSSPVRRACRVTVDEIFTSTIPPARRFASTPKAGSQRCCRWSPPSAPGAFR